jgi:predicted nucleotidyltransferase
LLFSKNLLSLFKLLKMKEDLLKLIEEKSPGSKPLYLVVRGSHAYGTNIETSDTDYSGIFIQSMDDILGNKYVEQINDDKNDTVIYEIRRFLELLGTNNPTVLELLNTPEDCVIYKDPIFDLILNDREKFITKICAKSLGGYAKQQISKAKGQNKKQNWEKDKVTRKEVLDFVYVIEGEKSIPWKVWNEDYNYEEKFIGVVNVPNARDIYAVYYDGVARNMFSENITESDKNLLIKLKKELGEPMGFGYKGLVKTGEGVNVAESNQLRLSSIPKGEEPICVVTYNKDGYTQHCNDYKSYQTWLEQRNESRWVDVQSHGQKIDGKNMMHCMRLIQMSREIAEGKGIIVRRPNAKELISIRRGEVDLQTLIDKVEKEIVEIDKLFEESSLPNSIDSSFINELIVKIRKYIYKLN